jgi:exonuclease III
LSQINTAGTGCFFHATSGTYYCLQELRTIDDKFPRRELDKAGYGATWHGQKSWNGVAIPAKGQEPLLTYNTVRNHSFRFERPSHRAIQVL